VKVKLLHYTPDAERLCAAAARSCYSEKPASELYEGLTQEKAAKVLRDILDSGHQDIIEHATFTFSVEGVSRALTHQLVRHRLASYSQQSQRYVSMKRASYILPPSVEEEPAAKKRYQELMAEIWRAYGELSELVPKEDARYVLPNACHTNITVTMNARELWHFFALRTCRRAQWEIFQMAWRMLAEVRKIAPALFADAGPGCVRGPCPEGKFYCGMPFRRGTAPKDFRAEQPLESIQWPSGSY